MRDSSMSPRVLGLAIAAALAFAGTNATAQDAATDGEATPRLADGRPDLNGTWYFGHMTPFGAERVGSASICVVACEEMEQTSSGGGNRRPPPDRPTYKPEHVAKVHDLNARQVEEDPALRCENPGLPRIGAPDKIVQTAGQVVFLYDDLSGNFFRIIPTDGRDHRADAVPSYLGDAVGRWEGDTLVVETVNFNDKTWLTDDGTFHTTDLRVVERISRDGDSLRWEATAYDPAVLAEPWTLRPRTGALSDIELVEAPPCDERDLEVVFDPTTSHDNPR